jgi:hypothetical protein
MVAVIIFIISFVALRNFCLYYCRSMSEQAASFGSDCEG